MREGSADPMSPTSSDPPQTLAVLDLLLRLSVLPLCAASIWVMATSKQANDSYGSVEYGNITGLKYLIWVSAISSGYALLAVIFSHFRWFSCDWLLFLFDQVMAYLMVTSGSAVVEVLYLSKEGDREVSWSEVCTYFGKFCNKIEVSLVLHLLALVCFLVLSLVSAYRLFSKFEAPSVTVSSKEAGRQGE